MRHTNPIDLPTEADTEHLGKMLSVCLSAPLTMSFSGEIGAGKTTLIRALLRALGVTSAIKSPTFSLVESYSVINMMIHHFDLYRIHDVSELEFIGFRDYFADNALCLIEWPERADLLDGIDIQCSITHHDAGRKANIVAHSPAGATVLSNLASQL